MDELTESDVTVDLEEYKASTHHKPEYRTKIDYVEPDDSVLSPTPSQKPARAKDIILASPDSARVERAFELAQSGGFRSPAHSADRPQKGQPVSEKDALRPHTQDQDCEHPPRKRTCWKYTTAWFFNVALLVIWIFCLVYGNSTQDTTIKRAGGALTSGQSEVVFTAGTLLLAWSNTMRLRGQTLWGWLYFFFGMLCMIIGGAVMDIFAQMTAPQNMNGAMCAMQFLYLISVTWAGFGEEDDITTPTMWGTFFMVLGAVMSLVLNSIVLPDPNNPCAGDVLSQDQAWECLSKPGFVVFLILVLIQLAACLWLAFFKFAGDINELFQEVREVYRIHDDLVIRREWRGASMCDASKGYVAKKKDKGCCSCGANSPITTQLEDDDEKLLLDNRIHRKSSVDRMWADYITPTVFWRNGLAHAICFGTLSGMVQTTFKFLFGQIGYYEGPGKFVEVNGGWAVLSIVASFTLIIVCGLGSFYINDRSIRAGECVATRIIPLNNCINIIMMLLFAVAFGNRWSQCWIDFISIAIFGVGLWVFQKANMPEKYDWGHIFDDGIYEMSLEAIQMHSNMMSPEKKPDVWDLRRRITFPGLQILSNQPSRTVSSLVSLNPSQCESPAATPRISLDVRTDPSPTNRQSALLLGTPSYQTGDQTMSDPDMWRQASRRTGRHISLATAIARHRSVASIRFNTPGIKSPGL